MGKKIFLTASMVIVVAALGFTAAAYTLVFHTSKQNFQETTVTIRERTFRVDVPKTVEEQTLGLGGREHLLKDRGMLFLFDSPGRYGIWMRGMKFPIDILWIKGDTLLGWQARALPIHNEAELETYYPPEPVDKILEINAGQREQYGFEVGDAVTFTFPR